MKFGSKAYDYALTELSRRRSRSKHEYEERIADIEMKFPEIASLRRELASTSINLSKVILSRNDNTNELIRQMANENLAMQNTINNLLIDNGYSPDYIKMQFHCENCEDSGFHEGRRCSCFNTLLKNFSSKELSGASHIKLSSFDTFNLGYYSDSFDENLGIVPRKKMEEILQYCERYAREFSIESKSICMSGQTGVGKTHLSLSIAKEIIAKGFNVIYGSSQDLLRNVEREHFGKSRDDKDALGSLLDCDLLIMDDLGTEFESSFYNSVIYNIINSRLNKGLPTIISTNLTLSNLETRYSDRVVSRLIVYDFLRFVGSDIRQIKRFK